eukprot:g13750.t1
MGSAGQGRCLDAFLAALGQASEGGEKIWYVSTLQLQLASMEFCRACRSVPTLRPITGVVWPASLRRLSFGHCFNQPIANVVWPDSLA